MVSNALTAATFSLGKGNTGVGDPTETLSAIDKGIKDVQTWASGIEAGKEKLKTDVAEKYREAELKAKENMPSNETAKANILKGLDAYKDQLYMNMKLVQNGNIKANDNLIFQENGKQSFDIFSQMTKEYGAQRDLTIKRAEGYTDEQGNVIPPISGGVEAALQDLQSRLGNPQFSKIDFDENGMGFITFYETEIDESTDTRVIKRDKEGNPIVQKGMSKMSVLAFNKGRNQRANRVYLDKESEAFIGKETALGQAYQIMQESEKGMVGTVVSDQRNRQKNELNQLLDSAANSITSTNPKVASILIDNGPLNERSIAINSMQVQEQNLSQSDLEAQIDYTYIDSDGVTQTGKKSKYILQKLSQNNQLVSSLSEEDKQAAANMAKSQLYSQLGRTVKAGSKVTTFDTNSASSQNSRKEKESGINRVDYANRIAVGGEDAMQALRDLKTSGLFTASNKFNEILSSDGLVDFDGRKAMKYTVQIDEKGNTEPRYVFTTDKDNKLLSQAERVEQSLVLIGTSPLQVKNLMEEFKRSGGILTKVDPNAKFLSVNISTGPETKLGMDTVVEGKGTKAVTLSNRITQAIRLADDKDLLGVNEDLLATGIKGALNEALNKSNQKIDGLRVSHDGSSNFTITGVNSKGKTITITGSQKSNDKDEMKLEVEALLNEFFQNLDSDEDITIGEKGKYD